MLVAVEPAVTAGIMNFAPRGFGFCAPHGAQFELERDSVEDVLIKAKRELYDTYSEQITAELCPHDTYCHIGLDGPEDLLPHGSAGFLIEPLPTWLPKRLRKAAHSGGHARYPLSKRLLERSGLVDVAIDAIVHDILGQHFMCRMLDTKYLTNRKADVVFLNAINDNENFTAWNEVLSQYLQYEMPVLTGVPLRDLIELRTHDYEAFRVYRDTFKGVIKDHIAKQPAITGKEAAEIYDDIVRPKLNKMNQKLKSVRDNLSSRLRRDVIITGGTLALGLSSGLVFPPAALSAGAAIPFAIDAAKTALERSDASDELKSDDLYFLWKVGQRSRRN